MVKKRNKKRSILLDVFLLTSIFGMLATIIFFTLFNEKTIVMEEKQGQVEYSIPQSETTESSSPYQDIKIVTDISNDSTIPFAIQYPLTTFDSVNKKIQQSIENSKQQYIKQMNSKLGKLNETIAGELNISFEILEYKQEIISFLLQKRMTIPGEKSATLFESYVFDKSSGKLYYMGDLMNTDTQSIDSLLAQVLDLTKKDENLSYLNKDSFNQYFNENPIDIMPYALTEEHIHLYFNGILHSQLNEPIHIAVPLTSINAILKEQLQQQMVGELEEITPIDTEKKLVALTFDDGPHPDVTPIILETLEKYNAKATFFLLGSRVQHYPDLAKKIYALGHEIGNHTWNHPVLTNMTEAQIIKEYSTTENAIVQAIGAPSTIFRPPYGATNAIVKEVIPSPQFNWTIDTEDWKHRNSDKLLISIKATIHPNAIILMHDIHLSTAHGLDSVLHFLQNEGYQFVTISDILNTKK